MSGGGVSPAKALASAAAVFGMLMLLLAGLGAGGPAALEKECRPAGRPAHGGLPGGLGGALDEWMARKVPGSPLVGLGDVFAREGAQARVDPRLLVAIALNESSLGTRGSGRDIHNAFGWGPAIPFASWEEGIATVAGALRSRYVDDGLDTIAEIQTRWAPVGAANDRTGLNVNWRVGVSRAYRELGGDPDGSVALAASSPSSRGGHADQPDVSITIKGTAADAEQASNIAGVLRVGLRLGVSRRLLVAAVATITVESTARNLEGGDRDSVGLFQQRPSQGWPASREIARDAQAFYERAMEAERSDPSARPAEIAQAVQRSAHPDAYARWEAEAAATVEGMLGGQDAPFPDACAGSEARDTGHAGGPRLVPTAASGRQVPVPPSLLQGGEAETLDAAILESAILVTRLFPGVLISDGWRSPSDPAYRAGTEHACGLAVDYVAARDTLIAIERWGRELGLPEALGPESDPAGHGDHAHLAFGRCRDEVFALTYGSRSGGTSGWVFPVVGPARFTDEFKAYRARGSHCGGTWHCAIDIMAARGTPVVAPFAGRLERVGMAGLGGNRLWLVGERERVYMAHFNSFAGGIRDGVVVLAGSRLGSVGNSGAPGAPPHLHIAYQRRSGSEWTWSNPVELLRNARAI